MKKILAAGVFMSLISFNSWAQYGETIRTGRPGASIGAYSVGKNILQFQQGIDFIKAVEEVDFFRDDDNNRIDGKEIFQSTYFSNIIRYGITRKFEISAVIDYSLDDTYYKLHMDDTRFFELNDQNIRNLDIGGRYNIIESQNGGPALCIQARMGLQPVLVSDTDPSFKFVTAMVQKFKKVHTITVNLGYIINPATPDQLNYTLNYALSIGDKIGIFIENYGYYPFSQAASNLGFRTFFDSGFSYLLTNDVQLDIQYGFGYNQVGETGYYLKDYFIGGGISWRLNLNN